MSGEEKSAKIPNISRKNEQNYEENIEKAIAELEANASKGVVITDEKGQTRVYDEPEDQDAKDLKSVPIMVFKNCVDGHYTINRRLTKLMVNGCTNITLVINGVILTRVAEIWSCKQVQVHANNQLKTLQIDMIDSLSAVFKSRALFKVVIWNQVDELNVEFLDEPEYKTTTGNIDMKTKFDDVDDDTDQFIFRIVNGKPLTERCIRLKNGHLSTEREAIEWEKKNAVVRDQYQQNFIKNAGINLNKTDTKKTPPNAKCPCGSDRKFKKCCMNKQQVTGLAGDKKITF